MDLKYQIEELISTGANDFEISKVIKEHIKNYLNSLDTIFTENQGKDFLVKHTKRIDQFLILIYKYTLRKFFGDYIPFVNQVPITLTAMGSFGREELCVYSDIDLMIVYKNIEGYNLEAIIESMLYLAWDSGLKLGHRVHKVDEIFEASNTDLTIKTAMLESRFLCGSNFLWMEIYKELIKIAKFDLKNFVQNKVKAHEKRRQQNPMSMEPDIKNSVGGLRDTNTILWLSKAILNISKTKDLVPKYISENEYKEYRIALEFLYRVRSALHLSAKKKQDTLNLEFIPDIANKLGFEDKKIKNAQQQLCEKTFAAMHTIDITCSIFIKKLVSSFHFDKKSIAKLRKNRIKPYIYKYDNLIVASRNKKPTTLLNIIKQCLLFDDKQIRFDISYIDYIRKSKFTKNNPPAMYKEFRKIFYNNYTYQIFNTLYKANLLKQLIKPIAHIKHQAQFDGYHKYPVDKHSLLGLYHLENIKESFIQALYDDLSGENKALIKLVILFHDIGKGRTGNHSEVGAKIFRVYAHKLEFSEEAIQMGNTLIKHHTHMSNVALREDIYSEDVVLAFITHIENPLILKLLYILTYCDINAVGTNIYTAFTSKLLKELYFLANEMFDKKELIGEAKRRIRKENTLKKNEEFINLPKTLQRKILSIVSNYFFIKHKPYEITKIAKIANDANPYEFEIENDAHLSISIIKSEDLNIGYLLGKLGFLDLINMEIFKLYDNKKYFKIDFNENVDQSDIPHIEELIKSSFDMNKKTTLCKPIIKENEIEIDFEHSNSVVKLTVNTKNQKGMMAYMMSVFDDEEIEVSTAKIQTIKNRARNLFLIEKKINLYENKDKLLELFITR
ncbi:HD domain-containing protein [Sulfurospirillum arcachonense]|uniref:[protein-PII] uridylyltransferase family protein n=1 Tax=Sulfurospirillum arcachonense TaxID=57666 RepID=UPI0004691D4A|nr:HD domain-containing protein [Sulfurospirillum arcachonense]